jgi:hypothetical protein
MKDLCIIMGSQGILPIEVALGYFHFPRIPELINTRILTLNMKVFLRCVYKHRALKYLITYQERCQMEL